MKNPEGRVRLGSDCNQHNKIEEERVATANNLHSSVQPSKLCINYQDMLIMGLFWEKINSC